VNEQLRREVGFLRHRMLTAKKKALLYQSDNITLSERIYDLVCMHMPTYAHHSFIH
jgi:hypothetical protein